MGFSVFQSGCDGGCVGNFAVVMAITRHLNIDKILLCYNFSSKSVKFQEMRFKTHHSCFLAEYLILVKACLNKIQG